MVRIVGNIVAVFCSLRAMVMLSQRKVLSSAVLATRAVFLWFPFLLTKLNRLKED